MRAYASRDHIEGFMRRIPLFYEQAMTRASLCNNLSLFLQVSITSLLYESEDGSYVIIVGEATSVSHWNARNG